MLFPIIDGLSKSSDAAMIGLWSLEKTAISANDIVKAVLRGLMKFYTGQLGAGDGIKTSYLPSEVKTIGLPGFDGSVKQNTSASPSEASWRCGGSVPVIL